MDLLLEDSANIAKLDREVRTPTKCPFPLKSTPDSIERLHNELFMTPESYRDAIKDAPTTLMRDLCIIAKWLGISIKSTLIRSIVLRFSFLLNGRRDFDTDKYPTLTAMRNHVEQNVQKDTFSLYDSSINHVKLQEEILQGLRDSDFRMAIIDCSKALDRHIQYNTCISFIEVCNLLVLYRIAGVSQYRKLFAVMGTVEFFLLVKDYHDVTIKIPSPE